MKTRLTKAVGLIFLLLVTGCGSIRSIAESPESLDGEYKVDNVDNITFFFENRRFLTVQQSGIYELAENEAKEPVVRICLEDIDRVMPEDYSFSEYVMKKDRMYTTLTFCSELQGKTEETVDLIFINGTDGLLGRKPFEGTYQIGVEGDDYQYQFKEDGTLILQVEQRYYAEDKSVTLTDAFGKTAYIYEKNEAGLELKNQMGETVLQLVLQE